MADVEIHLELLIDAMWDLNRKSYFSLFVLLHGSLRP
jgi:hypothetical protein